MSSSTKEDKQTAKEARRFLFENHDFGDEDALAILNRDRAKPAFSQEDLEAAKASGFAAGKKEGLEEALGRQETLLAQLLQKISADLTGLAASEERREEEKHMVAVHLALGIARKLLPGLARKMAREEIEAVISDVLDSRQNEPRIVIRVHDSLLDALKARIDALADENNFAGQLILLSDEDLQPTDCRVEWADGGTEKLFESLYSQVERTILKAVGGDTTDMRQAPAETPDPAENTDKNSEETVETADPMA